MASHVIFFIPFEIRKESTKITSFDIGAGLSSQIIHTILTTTTASVRGMTSVPHSIAPNTLIRIPPIAFTIVIEVITIMTITVTATEILRNQATHPQLVRLITLISVTMPLIMRTAQTRTTVKTMDNAQSANEHRPNHLDKNSYRHNTFHLQSANTRKTKLTTFLQKRRL